MVVTTPHELIPHGPFSLAAAARFLAGFTPAARPDAAGPGPLRLAFAVEGDWRAAGVAVTQDERGDVHLDPSGDADPAAALVQATRMLSLDVDGTGLAAVAERDPVVARLVATYPGLRPVCFGSPYEAAAWAVLSQRVRGTQAAAVRTRLTTRWGTTVPVDGEDVPAFPAPAALHAAAPELGLPEVKVERLRAVADAARDGLLDAAALRALRVDDALDRLRTIPGVGPFSAELILVRGAGHPDVFPTAEKRLHAEMRHTYGDVDLAVTAEAWRPFRSWVALLLRVDRDRRLTG